MGFVDRQYAEKFAAASSSRDQIGSFGAETFVTVVGSGTVTENLGPTNGNDNSTQGGTVPSFLFHNPGGALVDNDPDLSTPKVYDDSGANAVFWCKTNNVGGGYNMYIYYTTDGTFPEGAGGTGLGTTKVVQAHYHHNASDGNNWWTGSIIPKPSGTLNYKIGCFRDTDPANPGNVTPSLFPSGASQVAQKVTMMTTFQITNFNADTALVYPHNDYGVTQTGLSQGFHVLRLRPLLNRSGRAAIYDTVTQTFYYDTQLPQGQIAFPANDGDHDHHAAVWGGGAGRHQRDGGRLQDRRWRRDQ